MNVASVSLFVRWVPVPNPIAANVSCCTELQRRRVAGEEIEASEPEKPSNIKAY
ncbi:hypothetical protein O9929_14710 [Vibrio lentus]|nr:hypothetical protein [Vibrio lentus]